MPPSDSPALADAAPAVPAAAAPAVAPPGGGEQPAAAPAVSADAPASLPTVESTLLDKPADPPVVEVPPEPIDPAKYELKLPEGIDRDDPLVAAFLASAAESRLEGTAVQAMLDKAAPQIVEQMRAPYQAWVDLNKQWQDAARNDPEIGGQHFDRTISTVTSLLDRFGSPELKQALTITGAGNNPEVIRFLAKVGAAYVEATPGPAAGTAPPNTQTRERALRALYPSAAQPAASTAA